MVFGLVHDHFDEDFHRRLGTPRHSGAGIARHTPHQVDPQPARQQGENKGVDVENREINDFRLRFSGRVEIAEVMQDVFTGIWRLACSFVTRRHNQFFFQKTRNTACVASTRPISMDGQCRPG